MKQLFILLGEFVLITLIIGFIYYTNLSKRFPSRYTYNAPITSVKADLSDTSLKQELIYFLTKEMGLYEGNFEILDVIYLYTNDLSGADYILVTFRAPDQRICQITVARNSFPLSRWELNPKKFIIVPGLNPVANSSITIPAWMADLGVTSEEFARYYAVHPNFYQRGDKDFYNDKTGKYELPNDWHKSVFTFKTQKDKTQRLIPQTKENIERSLIDEYWKPDYSQQYNGPGYREYLYQKIKNSRQN